MTDRDILRQLAIVDWDFIEHHDLNLSAMHWYPGSFAPGLPGVLIDLLSRPGDTVFDPFCGVGTTAASSLLRGRNSLSCDLSLIGVMAGFATTGLLGLLVGDPRRFFDIFEELDFLVQGINASDIFVSRSIRSDTNTDDFIRRYSGDSLQNIYSAISSPPNVERLSFWYHEETLSRLIDLIRIIGEASISRFSKIVGFTMISAIARSLSSETRSWGHVADNVLPKEFVYKDVRRAASAWLGRTKNRLVDARRAAPSTLPVGSFEFRLTDWTTARKAEGAAGMALLLTSPPYGGAIDYGLAQRLSLYLFGLTDETIARMISTEIGARRKRFKPDHVSHWATQLADAVKAQIVSVNEDGYASFVMPHKDHGRDAGVVLLKQTLAESGWELWFTADRSVRQARTRQSWTSITKETVLVFAKGKN